MWGVCGVLGPWAPVPRCAHVAGAVLRAWCPGPLGSCSPVCCFSVLCGVCGVLGHLAPVQQCVRLVCFAVCRVFQASRLLFTGVRTRCAVLCLHSVLGLLAPVHRCACAVCCVVSAVSRATWLMFTVVLVWRVVRCAPCPGPRRSCSRVCTLGVRCFLHGVLGLLAPVHRCACVVCCMVCAVSWATWLPFTDVPAWRVLCSVCRVLGLLAPVHRCVVCCAWCPGPRGSRSPVCMLSLLCGVCGGGVGGCSLVPYRPLCIFLCAQE